MKPTRLRLILRVVTLNRILVTIVAYDFLTTVGWACMCVHIQQHIPYLVENARKVSGVRMFKKGILESVKAKWTQTVSAQPCPQNQCLRKTVLSCYLTKVQILQEQESCRPSSHARMVTRIHRERLNIVQVRIFSLTKKRPPQTSTSVLNVIRASQMDCCLSVIWRTMVEKIFLKGNFAAKFAEENLIHKEHFHDTKIANMV